MKVHSLILIGLMSFTTMTYAQDGTNTIAFDKTTHDFGSIDQKGGSQTHDFEFTNTGTEPIIIQNVSASCGCTTPGWTREPVPPGGRGFVKATYAPSGVMPFDKTLTVYSNAKPSTVILHIRGRVVAQPPTVEEQYPVAFGTLRLRREEIALARMVQGSVKKDSVEVLNTGDEPLKLTFSNVPKQAKIELVPAILQKNEKGFIRCTFNTAAVKTHEWGIVKYPVGMAINGKTQAGVALMITATIEDDFSKLQPADYEKAPIISTQDATYNFNTVKQGTKVTAEFEITNTGKSTLLIRKAYAECSCLKVTAPTSVEAGKKATVKVVLNTTKEEGNKFYPITLTTNAPSQSSTVLMMTGVVTK
jgi:hypothetical protein